MKKPDIRNQPSYTFSEAARYLRLPVPTLKTWFVGYRIAGDNGKVCTGRRLIEPASQSHLSFFNLVEAHVLAAIRRKHSIRPENVRSALTYTATHLSVDRPLLNENFRTNGVHLFVTRLGNLINASKHGQIEIREVLDHYLERIDRDPKGVPIKLFPMLSHRSPDVAPREVEINPFVSFGRPIVAGTNVPIEAIIGRFNAGDSMADLAEDFGIATREVESAVRMELLVRKAA
jgi:uncharacterized protein (DUF433 family)